MHIDLLVVFLSLFSEFIRFAWLHCTNHEYDEHNKVKRDWVRIAGGGNVSTHACRKLDAGATGLVLFHLRLAIYIGIVYGNI